MGVPDNSDSDRAAAADRAEVVVDECVVLQDGALTTADEREIRRQVRAPLWISVPSGEDASS